MYFAQSVIKLYIGIRFGSRWLGHVLWREPQTGHTSLDARQEEKERKIENNMEKNC